MKATSVATNILHNENKPIHTKINALIRCFCLDILLEKSIMHLQKNPFCYL